ncbi:MAG: stage II sporulation protein P [Syntrophomonadaceae bacterium]|jgi:stage II sporulation protein P
MNKRKLIIIALLCSLGYNLGGITTEAHEEREVGNHITLIDENNNIIHQTGMQVYVDDEYISADNSRYKVVEVDGNVAYCTYQGEEKMPVLEFSPQDKAWRFINEETVPVVGSRKPSVAIYHTHSDESYVPSDGKESIKGSGGIYDVGRTMASRLRKLGFNVEYSDNNHNPHDVNAYNRSRRTAAALLKKNPDVIIDIHRDAVPAKQYQAEVKGKNVTQIKMVVGRQNPNMKTNLEFAKRVKAVLDKQHPGLSKGILMGRGDYNQDLSPRSLLLEVGAHTNSKEEAQRAAALFADSIPTVIGVSAEGSSNPPAAKPLASESSKAWTTILAILVIVAAAAGGFYLINRGSKTS